MKAMIIARAVGLSPEGMYAPKLVPAAYVGLGLLVLVLVLLAIDLTKNGWRWP